MSNELYLPQEILDKIIAFIKKALNDLRQRIRDFIFTNPEKDFDEQEETT